MAKQESQDLKHVPAHTQRSTSTDKDEQKKQFERQVKNLRMDFALTFGTPEGKRVLKWIKEQAGWGKSVVGGNPGLGMDVLHGTLYNSVRLGMYTELRSMVPHGILNEVEYENIKEILE